MKKLVTMFLAVTLCMGLAVPAMAADEYGPYTIKNQYGNDVSFSSAKVETGTMTLNWFGETQVKENVTIITVQPGSTITYGGTGELMMTGYYEDGENVYAPYDAYLWFLSGSAPVPDVFGYSEAPKTADMLDFTLSFDSKTSESEDAYIILGDGSTSPSESVNPSTPFTDVAADAYYADAVKWAVEKDITAGTTATTFSPNSTCTTAQILTFLWRANGSPESGISNPFSDVSEDAYYYKAALWAYQNALVAGSAFGGNTPCTRSQTVTYLWKLTGEPIAAAAPFADVSSDAEYAQAVAWAVEQGITSGTSATAFSPDAACTRGQIVTFLYRWNDVPKGLGG